MNTTLNITYWSDFSCPYCYIGETRLKKAISNLGLTDSVTLTPKAFRLDPDAPLKSIVPTQERFAKKYNPDTDITEKTQFCNWEFYAKNLSE